MRVDLTSLADGERGVVVPHRGARVGGEVRRIMVGARNVLQCEHKQRSEGKLQRLPVSNKPRNAAELHIETLGFMTSSFQLQLSEEEEGHAF